MAVNGEGFRRFPPDFEGSELEDVTRGVDLINLEGKSASIVRLTPDQVEEKERLRGRVVKSDKVGSTYDRLLDRIREIKSEQSPSDPLEISLERYSWDSRVHSWSRFLSARRGNVPQVRESRFVESSVKGLPRVKYLSFAKTKMLRARANIVSDHPTQAMSMIQAHERWRQDYFPIDLTQPSLQRLLKSRAVAEIDIEPDNDEGDARTAGPVVYIDFAKLNEMELESETYNEALAEDVARAFVLYNETLLRRSPDPRQPKTCQFVDMTGFRLDMETVKRPYTFGVIKRLYATFEPNYPETLEKMVIYPVPRKLVRVVNAMLGFVNEYTRKKFIITDDLFQVCKELGWNLAEIETEGGVNGYMKKHLKHGTQFIFD